MAVTIFDVSRGSPAEKAGIKKGQKLLTINSNEIIDILDYRFYSADPILTIELENEDGTVRKSQIIKVEFEELGLEFESYLIDKQNNCRNNCIFCFIDQMPKGLRESLYVKDDDSRMSFLFGSYVTLTNITEREINRIVEMHISPINISVHTTDPELRVMMMRNENAGTALSVMDRFSKAGIIMNAQIVLCRDINDGEHLDKTMRDLAKYYPSLQSVAVVPVGLTKYRAGLYPLRTYDKNTALEVIERIERFTEQFHLKHESRLIYPADEFFVMAGKPLPAYDYYDSFDQLENGIGIMTLLKSEFETALEKIKIFDREVNVTIATGTLACEYMKELMIILNKKLPTVHVSVRPIINDFFGETITVAGLITGKDLINQLKTIALGDALIIPSVMLRFEQDLFLDGISVQDVEKALNIKVRIAGKDGGSLLKTILEK